MIRDRLALVPFYISRRGIFPRRLDRRDVRVDQYDLDALLLEGLDGLGTYETEVRRVDGVRRTPLQTAVVELARLADGQTAGTHK